MQKKKKNFACDDKGNVGIFFSTRVNSYLLVLFVIKPERCFNATPAIKESPSKRNLA